MARIRAVAAAVALGFTATACVAIDALPTADMYHYGEPVKVERFDGLWERSKAVLEREAFFIDLDQTRRSQLQVVTQWQTSLSPYRFEGKRRRAVVKFEQTEDEHWQVRVAVQQQKNGEIDEPMKSMAARWELDGSADARAEVILYKINAFFNPLGGEEEDEPRKLGRP